MMGRLAWVRVMVVAAGLTATLMVGTILSQAAPEERKVPVQVSELPAPIEKAVRDAFPKGRSSPLKRRWQERTRASMT